METECQCWVCKAHAHGLYQDVECQVTFDARLAQTNAELGTVALLVDVTESANEPELAEILAGMDVGDPIELLDPPHAGATAHYQGVLDQLHGERLRQRIVELDDEINDRCIARDTAGAWRAIQARLALEAPQEAQTIAQLDAAAQEGSQEVSQLSRGVDDAPDGEWDFGS